MKGILAVIAVFGLLEIVASQYAESPKMDIDIWTVLLVIGVGALILYVVTKLGKKPKDG